MASDSYYCDKLPEAVSFRENTACLALSSGFLEPGTNIILATVRAHQQSVSQGRSRGEITPRGQEAREQGGPGLLSTNSLLSWELCQCHSETTLTPPEGRDPGDRGPPIAPTTSSLWLQQVLSRALGTQTTQTTTTHVLAMIHTRHFEWEPLTCSHSFLPVL